ncbi:MAG: response regulator [Desulfobacteraceae bacterium]|nr:MAG: response regulator [Desulfobacteraceae bacterium]
MRAPHILLVDDETRFVTNLAKLLEGRGFRVSAAFDGPRALDALGTQGDIEVVVLDVRMPGLDGIETLRLIRKNHCGVEVIMLTGQACLEDGIEAVRAGAFDYLQKPCDIEDLISRIGAARNLKLIKRHPVLWPRTKAGEVILSGFVPLFPEDPLSRALMIFNRYREGEGGHMLFVVDRQNRLQGSITRREMMDAVDHAKPHGNLTWEWVRQHPEALPGSTLEQIMNRRVATVSPQTPLAEAAQLMLRCHYDSLAVVADGCVQGVIRLRDVLQYLQADEIAAGDGD